MSLILVRHGETPLNVARVLQPADTPLSAKGVAQAQAVATRLAGMNAAAILSSDLPRALQTAWAISQATGLAVSTTPLLQERNFGDLRGKPYDTLGFDPLAMPDAPSGGESTREFTSRVRQAFENALQTRYALEHDLIVVTHGLVIRALLQNHASIADGVTLPHRIGNTSISVVSQLAPYAVSLLDCMRHLDEGAAQEEKSGLSGG